MSGNQSDSANARSNIVSSESKNPLAAIVTPERSHFVQVWIGQRSQITAVWARHTWVSWTPGWDATVLLAASWGPSTIARVTVHASDPCPTSPFRFDEAHHTARTQDLMMSYIIPEGGGHFINSTLPQSPLPTCFVPGSLELFIFRTQF